MLKKLFFTLLLALLYGCQGANIDVANSKNVGTSDNKDANPSVPSNNGCPLQPQAVLDPKNVKQVSLEQGSVTETGQLVAGQDKGFAFKAEKGAKLSFKTKDDICVWVFTPDNNLLSNNDIPGNGSYTIQVATLKGSTNFTLDIGFGNLSPTASGSSSVSIYGELNQKKAEKLVQAWLNAKSKIFASPFDVELARRITAGPVYNDIVKPNGAVDWLKNNNSYYTYTEARISKVWLFSNHAKRPTLKVSIVEDRTLRTNGNIDASQSGKDTSTYTYSFVREDGEWKIYDYKGEDS